MHHDLNAEGKISYYNIMVSERIFTHIPARLVESVKETHHEHEERK